MIKATKRPKNKSVHEQPSTKKIKKENSETNQETPDIIVDIKKNSKTRENVTKYNKKVDKKFKKFSKISKNQKPDKPTDWMEFKKKKKELQIKRKQSNNLYDINSQAKKISEVLRRKTLKGGVEERIKLTKKLHVLLGGQGNYPKLVMTHDMARVVQYILKFGDEQIRSEVANELIDSIPLMLQSKYAKFCVKRMLKYGNTDTRFNIIKACYGNVVKLASHAVSAAILDYAYTTWATSSQKNHFVQEFFGDIYKQSKDNSVKHLRDCYSNTPDMKNAALGATKANLARVLNKQLLDSHLIQTVLMQFLQECSGEDRGELVSQLSEHVVVLSNSKEGARAAMTCVWQGNKKDKKTIIKSLKEHVIPLSKHEHGHSTVIAVLDSVDDTVLLNKVLLKELITQAYDLATDEWGRKVLLWLVAPGDTVHFHPVFVKELDEGRQNSTSKKEYVLRRKELLDSVISELLKQIAEQPNKWLAKSSIAIVALAILKAGYGPDLSTTIQSICDVVTDSQWFIEESDKKVLGIEHSGLHMVLKKLIQYSKDSEEHCNFIGAALIKKLDNNILSKWIESNRGCFILVTILESCGSKVQNKLKEKLKILQKLLKSNTSTGAKLLLKKLMEK